MEGKLVGWRHNNGWERKKSCGCGMAQTLMVWMMERAAAASWCVACCCCRWLGQTSRRCFAITARSCSRIWFGPHWWDGIRIRSKPRHSASIHPPYRNKKQMMAQHDKDRKKKKAITMMTKMGMNGNGWDGICACRAEIKRTWRLMMMRKKKKPHSEEKGQYGCLVVIMGRMKNGYKLMKGMDCLKLKCKVDGWMQIE